MKFFDREDMPRMVAATERFGELRRALGLTKAKLAQEANVDARGITRLENGGRTARISLFRLLQVLERHSGEELNARDFVAELSDLRHDPSPAEILHKIPEQNSVVRFGPSPNGKLTIAPALPDENEYDHIEALRAELLPLLEVLRGRYEINQNTPQAALFGPLTRRYESELSKSPRDINFAVLYAIGTHIDAARGIADREIKSGEWPDSSTFELETVDTISHLHGPLIMSSGSGRRLVNGAKEYNATTDSDRREDKVFAALGEAVAKSSDVFEQEAIEAIQIMTAPIASDPQPQRTRYLRTLISGSLLTVFVGAIGAIGWGGIEAAASVLTTDPHPAALSTSVVAGWFFGRLAWEAIKNTRDVKGVTDGVTLRIDALSQRRDDFVRHVGPNLIRRIDDFAEREVFLLWQLSELDPILSWAKKILISRVGGSKQP